MVNKESICKKQTWSFEILKQIRETGMYHPALLDSRRE